MTMGEPAGVGGEISIKAWNLRERKSVPPFFLIDDPQRIEALARRLGHNIPTANISEPAEAIDAFDTALPILRLTLPAASIPGVINSDNALAVISAIDKAVDFVISGEARALVTNPIHKSALYDAGFAHPGHTEFLAHLCQEKLALQETPHPVMMLAAPDLKVVPATIHMPLSRVAGTLNEDLIVRLLTIMADALQSDFAFSNPRIAVAGLNPHAGEGGALGEEDNAIIAPAIKVARAAGLDVTGPHPADTLFHTAARETYDAVLAMYHDQALIPIKTLDFDCGVNITLGLPIIRTSPDHGTALDIAGTGKASPTSLIEALYTAQFIADTHARNEAS
jgi:4-hydroxythreonine-4-phosphate dehydrogenase